MLRMKVAITSRFYGAHLRTPVDLLAGPWWSWKHQKGSKWKKLLQRVIGSSSDWPHCDFDWWTCNCRSVVITYLLCDENVWKCVEHWNHIKINDKIGSGLITQKVSYPNNPAVTSQSSQSHNEFQSKEEENENWKRVCDQQWYRDEWLGHWQLVQDLNETETKN